MTSDTVRRQSDSGKERENKNQPAAARNLMPPFPEQWVYGTGPRRQGYPEGELFQNQGNFSLRRSAPLTAPVPFQKTCWILGKGGGGKAIGSWLAPALMPGQTAASKVRGLRPCDPARKKSRNNRLTGEGLLMEAATVRESVTSRISGPAPYSTRARSLAVLFHINRASSRLLPESLIQRHIQREHVHSRFYSISIERCY
jgi:hypothetical protein